MRLKAHMVDLQQYTLNWVNGDNRLQAPERALEVCSALAPIEGLSVPHFEHHYIVFQMPQTWHPLTNAKSKAASWVLQFDGGAASKAGTRGVLLWGPNSKLVVAQALWFGKAQSIVNCAKIHALLWGMSKLKSLRVSGKIVLLGNSHLGVDFCMQRTCPSKPEQFRATNEIAAIWQQQDGVVMFHYMR